MLWVPAFRFNNEIQIEKVRTGEPLVRTFCYQSLLVQFTRVLYLSGGSDN